MEVSEHRKVCVCVTMASLYSLEGILCSWHLQNGHLPHCPLTRVSTAGCVQQLPHPRPYFVSLLIAQCGDEGTGLSPSCAGNTFIGSST